MKSILILFILFLSFGVKSQDMQQYLKDTRALIKKGDHKESLNRLIWFHEHALEYNKAMNGVRLSFALSHWKSLGKVYSPAIDSLIAIRDRKTAQLINNGAPTDFFFRRNRY